MVGKDIIDVITSSRRYRLYDQLPVQIDDGRILYLTRDDEGNPILHVYKLNYEGGIRFNDEFEYTPNARNLVNATMGEEIINEKDWDFFLKLYNQLQSNSIKSSLGKRRMEFAKKYKGVNPEEYELLKNLARYKRMFERVSGKQIGLVDTIKLRFDISDRSAQYFERIFSHFDLEISPVHQINTLTASTDTSSRNPLVGGFADKFGAVVIHDDWVDLEDEEIINTFQKRFQYYKQHFGEYLNDVIQYLHNHEIGHVILNSLKDKYNLIAFDCEFREIGNVFFSEVFGFILGGNSLEDFELPISKESSMYEPISFLTDIYNFGLNSDKINYEELAQTFLRFCITGSLGFTDIINSELPDMTYIINLWLKDKDDGHLDRVERYTLFRENASDSQYKEILDEAKTKIHKLRRRKHEQEETTQIMLNLISSN
jgi:hypothetical protein